MEHLDTNNILTDIQHGFRAKLSCEIQLLIFVNELHWNLANGSQIDLAILDFSRAFDVVHHDKLLHKLSYYSIQGQTLSLIRFFLLDSTQRVSDDDKTSKVATVLSGVPQGSVL